MTSQQRSRLGRILSLQVQEDQLTETIALLLESDGAFASRAVQHLSDNALKPSGELTISTRTPEKLVLTTLRPDLEIGWSDGLVWVEVKRDMLGESRPDQLHDYYTALQKKARGRTRALVYLTRAGVDTPPDVDVHRDWIDLASWLRDESPPLARDLARYLREKGLDVAPVNEDAIRVMRKVDRTRDTFLALFDQTWEKVHAWADGHSFAEEGNEPSRPLQRSANWHNWWHALRPPTDSGWHPDLLFEWNLWTRESGEHAGERRFAAGLTINNAELRGRDVWDEGYADSLAGFEFERLDRTDRLCRFWAVEALLNGGEIKAQADTLYRLISESFDALVAVGPPGVGR